jgi:hypothetical protein
VIANLSSPQLRPLLFGIEDFFCFLFFLLLQIRLFSMRLLRFKEA